MSLERFPRVRLGHLPTPLELLPRLSERLGGPTIYIKRDDCTGLAFGGNKVRKLEFLMAQAIAENADTVITTGGLQSNHVRQTAAAATRLGLATELVLVKRPPWLTSNSADSGNFQLDGLLGATLHVHPEGVDRDVAMRQLCDELQQKGRRPFVIPAGGSTPIGALGYVAAASEIQSQAAERNLKLDALVLPSGTGGTQAGLIVGLRDQAIRIVGIDVDAAAEVTTRSVAELAAATTTLLGSGAAIEPGTVEVRGGYAGEAYGLPTAGMCDALKQVAQLESVLLDPVYTGKAMAGLVDLIQRGELQAGQNVVFLHTGGAPALFAYKNLLT